MTNWLRGRLVALLCAGVLVGGASFLHAQNSYPTPAKTPEEAATKFYAFLAQSGRSNSPYEDAQNAMNVASSNTPVTEATLMAAVPFGGSISRAQATGFSNSESTRRLVSLLAQEANEPQFDAQVVNKSGGQTIVSIAPAPAGKGRDVVVVAEDGGYRVDLKQTYARWNNLSGEQLDESWWEYTGIVSPSLSKNERFLRSQCQTNLKQVGLGILQYTQDYDEKYPAGRDWMDVVQPYVKSNNVFRCPSVGAKGYGYAFNSKFNRISLSRINSPATAINVYETLNLARNVSAPFTGRAYRHELHEQDGMNIAFADGHIKWFAQGAKAPLVLEPSQPSGFLTVSTEGTR